MSDLISRQAAIDALKRIFDRCEEIEAHLPDGDPDKTGYKMFPDYMTVWKYLRQLPSAQPELIEKAAYIRGFEQGRTQGMIDTKAEEVAQPTADVVEVEKVNKIYEKLEDLFDIPCNFSPCDEIMLESERCRKDCGNISCAECWRRYFEVVCDGERADK